MIDLSLFPGAECAFQGSNIASVTSLNLQFAYKFAAGRMPHLRKSVLTEKAHS